MYKPRERTHSMTAAALSLRSRGHVCECWLYPEEADAPGRTARAGADRLQEVRLGVQSARWVMRETVQTRRKEGRTGFLETLALSVSVVDFYVSLINTR